jgi:hypothetical protein
MHRYILTALGCFALATTFSIAPIGFQDASNSFGAKIALAQPGGNGKGKGKGQARGRGDTATINGVANGHSSEKSANGRALGHEIDGVSGVGHDTAPGQAKKASYDGYDGYNGTKFEGSFNSVKAAKRAFEVSSYSSRLHRVKEYLDAVQALSELSDGDMNLDAAITEAAEKAADASSRPVTESMLDEVNAISNEKELTDSPIDLEKDRTDEVAEEARAIQEGS